MKLHVIAVGRKMPTWINTGFEDYARRMPPSLRVQLTEIKPADRAGGESTLQWQLIEAQRVRSAWSSADAKVILDERGEVPTTMEFARRVERWRDDARDVAFVIGGADGTAHELQREGDWLFGLSRLTLPHGLARVLLAEQFYRVASLLAGHPYHRK